LADKHEYAEDWVVLTKIAQIQGETKIKKKRKQHQLALNLTALLPDYNIFLLYFS